MQHRKWQAIAAVSGWILAAFIASAWLAAVLVERWPHGYIHSSAGGWDNFFLPLLLPALTLLLVCAPLQPGLTRTQVRTAWLACVVYMLFCAFFGARGFGVVLAIEAVLQLRTALFARN